ncbi:MAG: molybdopterin-dependent oxidoreductase [Nitrosomonadales bacterium]|mgnify:FL=1|nr:molybdopterin-dependent oxidoreductase [Nitrosomonadales bacterium]
MKQTKSTCCYCGVGCGIIIESDNNKIINVVGDPDHPANFGMLCTKGSTLHLSASSQEFRGLKPKIRYQKNELRQEVSWNNALDYASDKFSQIINKHGSDAVAFYISGQLMTEDYYVFNKLAKGLIQTNNLDTNSRLCMSSAVAGYKRSLGVDAPPACYEDIDFANCIFIAGSNTAYAHPILFRRVEAAKEKNPDLKVIVVDPRRTETAKSSDIHLAIIPGTDVALFNGLLHIMLWEELVDDTFIKSHTEGFEALKKTVRDYTPKLVADICGISVENLNYVASIFAKGPTLSMYCMGLNQSIHGTDKNSALINLHLATGQIGKKGCGPLSLTGQPNAMGGREVGGMANSLPGHRELINDGDREEVCKLWNIDNISKTPGKTAVEMFESIEKGEIKAVWIACTNPAHSMPNNQKVIKALSKAELVIVQDAFTNIDTMDYADIYFPTSTWSEKEGTVTNSERRITRVKSAIDAPGEAKHDWQIVTEFAQKLQKKLGRGIMFDYQSTEQIFLEHQLTTKGRDLDITGLSYDFLEKKGPQQWPFTIKNKQTTNRLYTDNKFYTQTQRANFINTIYLPTSDKLNSKLPFRLITGRLRDHWHGMSRTDRVTQLAAHDEQPFLSMNEVDMLRRNLKNGDLVKVSNERGNFMTPVIQDDDIRSGELFFPMHWGNQNMTGSGVNAITTSACDPISKQPELKYATVKLEKIDFPWQMTLMKKNKNLSEYNDLKKYIKKFDFAFCNLYGHSKSIVVFKAFSSQKPDHKFIQELESSVGFVSGAPVIVYDDKSSGVNKKVLVRDDKLESVFLVGEMLASNWLKDVMTNGSFTPELRLWALAPITEPPTGQKNRGKIICSCFDVAELELKDNIKLGGSLEYLKHKLKCGTNCGSCIPEIKSIIKSTNLTTVRPSP